MKKIIYTPFLFLLIITGFIFAVPGCQDDTACNYNESATEAGACEYADEDCEACSGEIDGTGVVLDVDADDDTYCDDIDQFDDDETEWYDDDFDGGKMIPAYQPIRAR